MTAVETECKHKVPMSNNLDSLVYYNVYDLHRKQYHEIVLYWHIIGSYWHIIGG